MDTINQETFDLLVSYWLTFVFSAHFLTDSPDQPWHAGSEGCRSAGLSSSFSLLHPSGPSPPPPVPPLSGGHAGGLGCQTALNISDLKKSVSVTLSFIQTEVSSIVPRHSRLETVV